MRRTLIKLFTLSFMLALAVLNFVYSAEAAVKKTSEASSVAQVSGEAAAEKLLVENVKAWLVGAPISDEGKALLEKQIKDNPDCWMNGWTARGDKALYVLGAVQIPQDSEPELQISLDTEALNRSFLKAVTGLAVCLDGNRLDRKKFSDETAANYALKVFYEGALKGGVQSQSANLGKEAVTLVWLADEAAKAAAELKLPAEAITADYCDVLYKRARELFERGNFPEALEVFHKIHYMEWANVEAYLGASTCFLKMDQKDDSGRLASELFSTLGEKMTDSETAATARILYGSGLKDEGFSVMEKAYLKLQSEVKK